MIIIIVIIIIGDLGSQQRIGARTGGLWNKWKLQHYWDRPEYWEESWKLEGTCYHSDFCGKPSANTGVNK